MNQKKEYRNKSIPQLLEMDIKDTRTIRTINNKYLERIGTLFSWAEANGYYFEGRNPVKNLYIVSVDDEDTTTSFDKADLIKLFHSDEYKKDTHKHPFQFWCPIIALFTGARQNEIAQFHLSDIRKDKDGIWVFDINKREDKTLKTPSSKRLVPIHSFLQNDLKIYHYVKKLKDKGEKRLFPEIKKKQDSYGPMVSRWFNNKANGYKHKCKIFPTEDGMKKDFHSFRNTFLTHLDRKSVPYRMLQQVVGHSRKKDDTEGYIKGNFPPKQLLKEVVSKIDYKIDFNHLKKSRYVIK